MSKFPSLFPLCLEAETGVATCTASPATVHASTRQDLATVVDRNPILYYATVLGAIIDNDIGRFLFLVQVIISKSDTLTVILYC